MFISGLNKWTALDGAADEGPTFHMDKVTPVNSFDAHRLIHFATEHDKQDEAVKRLFAAYFTNGESIADHGLLLSVAEEIGLDEAAAKSITGVPFFIIDDTYAISGAQGVLVVFSGKMQAFTTYCRYSRLADGAER